MMLPLIAGMALWRRMALGSAEPRAGKAEVMHLVELLHDRLALARDIAKAKYNSGTKTVEDPKREAAVLAAVAARSAASGLDREEARALFVNQINASKVAQTALIHAWFGHPKFRYAPNLGRDIRPRLDKLTTSIILAFKSARPWLHGASGRAAVDAAIRTYAFRGPDGAFFRPAWSVAVMPLVLRVRRGG